MKKIMFNDRYGLTQAVLEGRKTMTRRIVPQSVIDKYSLMEDFTIIDDARYDVGELVAIAQRYLDIYDKRNCVNLYDDISKQSGWNNKLFVSADLMLHHIRITDVKVERLQDISDEDCIKEGIWKANNVCFEGVTYWYHGLINSTFRTPRDAFAALIDKVSGKGAWESNPWVFVYEFELVD